MDISDLRKGAVRDTEDTRDFKVLGSVYVDFSNEFRLPVPPDTDQAQADCCVGEGWSSYHWQIRGSRFAVRSLFAYIAQSYGASIRDGGLWIKNNGQQTFVEVPDPNPKTPQNMRSKGGLNAQEALQFKEFDSFNLPQADINGIAWGIKNYKGVVFGVNGTNAGWKNLEVPTPPAYGENPEWGHALYAMGYHTHSDGQKCIICKSSWCNSVKEHHIRENYFVTGNTFNGWTLIPKGTPMQQFKTQNYHGELRIVLQASTPEQWAALLAVYGIDPNQPIDETI